MNFDLSAQPETGQRVAGHALPVVELAKSWAPNRAAWSRIGFLAILVASRLKGSLTRLLTPGSEADGLVARMRRSGLIYRPLLMPLLACLFTAIGKSVARSLFDSGEAGRIVVPFSISHGSDINQSPAMMEAAIGTHPRVLDAPGTPGRERLSFGDNIVDFSIKLPVNRSDGRSNKITPGVLLLIWNALIDNDIEIPCPQRVVEIRSGLPLASL